MVCVLVVGVVDQDRDKARRPFSLVLSQSTRSSLHHNVSLDIAQKFTVFTWPNTTPIATNHHNMIRTTQSHSGHSESLQLMHTLGSLKEHSLHLHTHVPSDAIAIVNLEMYRTYQLGWLRGR